jgi:hypothetical protein
MKFVPLLLEEMNANSLPLVPREIVVGLLALSINNCDYECTNYSKRYKCPNYPKHQKVIRRGLKHWNANIQKSTIIYCIFLGCVRCSEKMNNECNEIVELIYNLSLNSKDLMLREISHSAMHNPPVIIIPLLGLSRILSLKGVNVRYILDFDPESIIRMKEFQHIGKVSDL